MHPTGTPTLVKDFLPIQNLHYIFLADNVLNSNIYKKKKLAIRSEDLIGLTNRDYSIEQLDCVTGHLYSNVGTKTCSRLQ